MAQASVAVGINGHGRAAGGKVNVQLPLLARRRQADREAIAKHAIAKLTPEHDALTTRIGLEQKLAGDVVDDFAGTLVAMQADQLLPPERVGFSVRAAPSAAVRAALSPPRRPWPSRLRSRARMPSISGPKRTSR